ncbi:MAG: GNAT family N-acetyltransferase [Kordiimonas sp.]
MDILSLRSNESALIGKIISDGFRDDAVNLWAFNGEKAMWPMFTHMAKHLYLKSGYGHRTSDGKAGTLWLPPKVIKGYGLTGNLNMFSTLISHAGLRGIKNSVTIDNFLTKKRPKEPHHYLFAISVHPDHQGKGIGGQLMRKSLSQIDEEKSPAYLENSKAKNIPFYRSFGFEIMEEVRPAKDCPPLWLMWRKPNE